MSKHTEELFQKFDKVCQSRQLTNVEIAFLLQVTPAMVTRYRARTAAIPETRKDKFKIAMSVLKASLSKDGYFKSGATSQDRLKTMVEKFRELHPEELKKEPMVF
jgi:predicted transcriptional regulator